MSGKSNYLENKMLDHVLGGPDYTRPATVYVALYTVTPDDTGGGTEVAGFDYARVAVANNDTNWPAAVGGAKANGTTVTFPTANGGNWGTCVAFGVFDAAVAGNLLVWGPLTPNVPVNDGQTASFAPGDLDYTED